MAMCKQYQGQIQNRRFDVLHVVVGKQPKILSTVGHTRVPIEPLQKGYLDVVSARIVEYLLGQYMESPGPHPPSQ